MISPFNFNIKLIFNCKLLSLVEGERGEPGEKGEAGLPGPRVGVQSQNCSSKVSLFLS